MANPNYFYSVTEIVFIVNLIFLKQTVHFTQKSLINSNDNPQFINKKKYF